MTRAAGSSCGLRRSRAGRAVRRRLRGFCFQEPAATQFQRLAGGQRRRIGRCSPTDEIFGMLPCERMSVPLTAPPQFQGGCSGAEGRRLKTSVSKTPPLIGINTPTRSDDCRHVAPNGAVMETRQNGASLLSRIIIGRRLVEFRLGEVQTMLSGSSQARPAGAAAAPAGQTAQRPARRTRSRLGFVAGLAEAGECGSNIGMSLAGSATAATRGHAPGVMEAQNESVLVHTYMRGWP